MSGRWRTWLFVVLAVLMVALVYQVSDRVAQARLKERNTLDLANAQVSKPPLPKSEPTPTITTVPLYTDGSLFAKPKKKKTKKRKAKKRPVRIVRKAALPQRFKPVTTPDQIKSAPTLVVDYKRIGFRRYLDVIESVGRFFTMKETENGSRLGSEISLKLGRVISRVTDLSVLAIKRPHLVSDKKIQDRLALIDLPDGTLNDRVVLALVKSFDAALWNTILRTLQLSNLHITQISQINGTYIERDGSVFLH